MRVGACGGAACAAVTGPRAQRSDRAIARTLSADPVLSQVSLCWHSPIHQREGTNMIRPRSTSSFGNALRRGGLLAMASLTLIVPVRHVQSLGSQYPAPARPTRFHAGRCEQRGTGGRRHGWQRQQGRDHLPCRHDRRDREAGACPSPAGAAGGRDVHVATSCILDTSSVKISA